MGLAVGHAANWRAGTRMQLALLIVAAYVAASASYAMWWGGLSVPARLFTVLLPVRQVSGLEEAEAGGAGHEERWSGAVPLPYVAELEAATA